MYVNYWIKHCEKPVTKPKKAVKTLKTKLQRSSICVPPRYSRWQGENKQLYNDRYGMIFRC